MPNLTANSHWPVYVEDYIEILCQGFGQGGAYHKVKLASYDVSVLESLYQQVHWDSRPLTDRQSDLILRLIEKYTRQLKNLGIDNSSVLDPATRQYRYPIRKISRDYLIYREDDHIVIRFPYVQRLIDYIKIGRKNLDGTCEWDPEGRAWRLGFTESNLSFAMTLATAADAPFRVDEDLLALFEQIGEVEARGYDIRLVDAEGGYRIENAAQSLKDYVNEHLGGFGADNLVRLVDHSAILGYTLSPEIQERVRQQLGENMLRLMVSHRNNIEPDSMTITEIYRYAVLTDRFPVLIYCPNPDALTIEEVFRGDVIPADKIYQTGRGSRRKFDPKNDRVFFTRVLDRQLSVNAALKVSFHNMNYGANRMRWLNSPGKIVYYCTELIPRE